VREFGMTAIANGLALHGGFIPFDATFLVFSDYARNGVRMSALIPAHAIHVYTHDSIGLGEDGPTHQPVEHLASLRYIPNNDVWRPCDAVESAVSWKAAITRQDGLSCLVFSRQNLPHQPRSAEQIAQIERGGYVLADAAGTPDVILIATGSKSRWPPKPRPSWMRLVSRPAWSRCRPPTCSCARMRPTVNRCCRTRCASAWPWKPVSPVSGASSSAWTVP
jgi:transketolase